MANKYIAKKKILPKYSYSEPEIFQKKEFYSTKVQKQFSGLRADPIFESILVFLKHVSNTKNLSLIEQNINLIDALGAIFK